LYLIKNLKNISEYEYQQSQAIPHQMIADGGTHWCIQMIIVE